MLLLQELCIDVIVREFGHFYNVYLVTKYEHLQREFGLSKERCENLQQNFEFLQRKYSAELAKRFHNGLQFTCDGLKDIYLTFCLNNHLGYLEGAWIQNRQYFNCMSKIFCLLPNLTQIVLKNSVYCDEILKNVAEFCPNIVDIDATYSNTSDKGIISLCETRNGVVRCPKLKNVIINSSSVTEYGAELLIRKLPSLEFIDYAKLPYLLHDIHQENVVEFDELQTYNLTQIQFKKSSSGELLDFDCYTDCYTARVLKTCLTICPKLKYLSCCISREDQLNLFANSHLKILILQCSLKNGIINIDNFLKTNGCDFTNFKTTDCTMSISALGKHCPILKEFIADCVVFKDNKYDFKPHFASLTECTFDYIEPSSNKGICLLLSSSPKLESVSFTKCIVSFEIESQILMWCNSPCAKEINFRFVRLEKEFLKSILLNGFSLKKMSVEDCSIDVDDAEEEITKLGKKLPNKPKIIMKNLKMDRITFT